MSSLAISALKPLLPFIRFVWRRLPSSLLQTKIFREMGAFFYDHYVRNTFRGQSHYTWFFRNAPQLQLLGELVSTRHSGERLRVASIGCSVGAELYSTVWTLRTRRPDLDIVGCGVDVSAAVIDVARAGKYRPSAPPALGGTLELKGTNVLATDHRALAELMDLTPSGEYRVKDWIREGVKWMVADAADPDLAGVVGPQDLVMACNVLGPMDDAIAEACLRNLADLVAPGGYLVLDGIDLDVKSRVTKSLSLIPITRYIEEIHTADPTKGDWPWTRWSHGPIDYDREDWPYRYSTVFALPPHRENGRMSHSSQDQTGVIPQPLGPGLAIPQDSTPASSRS